ncbi:hypothetical protein [Chitinophaga caseinilytica]|uniref:hypothetical protein n=1 Tax=Chitinophaga caseinilytica TaxID=2267521 RepID=UPI003C3064FD
MKRSGKRLLLALAVLCTTPALAQEKIESLSRGGKVRVGGFGAPTIKFTTFDDQMGVLLGGYAGVMLNSRLMLGAGAYALVNNIEAPRPDPAGPALYWNMWYTGFVPEYTIKGNKLVHLAVGALVGGGGVMKNERYKSWDEFESIGYSSFFVGEPHVNLELNITSYLRLGIGGSYRFVRGSGTEGITDEKLSGPSAHFTIKAGRF